VRPENDSVQRVADRDAAHESRAIIDFDFGKTLNCATDSPQRFSTVAARESQKPIDGRMKHRSLTCDKIPR
jgi:hypothetical protein